MSFYQADPTEESFPQENYAAKRRINTPSEVIIPYKPVEEPAWQKHNSGMLPKPARFEKLNQWDKRCNQLQTVVKLAVVAAGAAAVAGPVLMRIPH